MKIVKVNESKTVFRFECRGCGCVLEATEDDLKFVKRGVLKYSCPKCKKDRTVKETKITIDPVYEEV